MKRYGAEELNSTQKTARRKFLGDSKNVRFELVVEALQKDLKENRAKSKAARTEEDLADFNTFYSIDLRDNTLELFDSLKTDDELKTSFNVSHVIHDRRTRGQPMDFSDIVSHVFDNDILDELISWNLERNEHFGLPGVMYGRNQGMSLA
jgi:hypothetical protein